ncbi:Ethanolamine-phosphate cytidylyltransferase [Triticum urartu]|uniref:ethanolamine-phosphate cytidylyltransferase n=1 Tax=Triticum urartu TaxID=4572 RepID=M7ZL80_TRIUA|nr:Ethanolamine-phosphate cytidylyltransferase [Triticum urartu]
MVRAVKWVDDVIPDAPYAITEDFMNKLFNEYNIDYIIHGDDPCLLPDGTDAYALAKKAGRYKQIKRTEGVSTTDIVGRMLLCVRERPVSDNQSHSSLQRQFSHGHGQNIDDSGFGNGTKISHFLPTSRRIVQFSNGRGPGPDSRVVYIDGAFDLFHAGHVEILRLARGLGDFLLVGIHTDQTIRWPFLFDDLRQYGFGTRFLDWLAILFSLASTRVLVNENQAQQFGTDVGFARAIRYLLSFSCSLSDMLGRLLHHATELGVIQRLHPRRPMPSVSLYADDMILFCLPTLSDVTAVKSILQLFGRALGL